MPRRTSFVLLAASVGLLMVLSAVGLSAGPARLGLQPPGSVPAPPRGSTPISGILVLPGSAVPAAGLTVTLNVNRSSAPENAPINFSGTVSPGSGGPFTLSWGGPPPSGCTSGPTSIPSGTFYYDCRPAQTGTFTVSVGASNGTGSSGSGSASLTVYPDLGVTLTASPSTLSSGTQLSVGFQISGGASPYTLQWNGLPSPCQGNAPNSEPSSGSFQFQCNPTQTGTAQVNLLVTDSGAPTRATSSAQQSVQVNSNGNNNNRNNNSSNSNHNGNGSGNFSIPGLSNLGSLLSIFLLGALIVFLLLVITAVSTLATAILVARRLPPRTKGGGAAPTQPCPACGKPVPAGSKFCLECGKPIGPDKPDKSA
ncbi:MAG TPA: zinc ribbon domain-containing protein [Thermoplasmata archaeon]|nr:zinc ribbon domain-containing protein [Thermoplasmata archaeon]